MDSQTVINYKKNLNPHNRFINMHVYHIHIGPKKILFVSTPQSMIPPLPPSSSSGQVKINTGVAPPERMAPGFLNHLELGEGVAVLMERCTTSHSVFTIGCPADLKTVLLEGAL